MNPWLIGTLILVLLIVIGAFIFIVIKGKDDSSKPSSPTPSPIFDQSEMAEVKKGILTVMWGDGYNAMFDESGTTGEELGTEFNAAIWGGISYHLLTKYGPKLKNIKVPASKQKAPPSNVHNNPKIPTAINNYTWWLANVYQPQGVTGEASGFAKCSQEILTTDAAYISKDANGRLMVGSEYVGTVMDNMKPCFIDSKFLNESLDDIINQVNKDLVLTS